MSELLPCPFCGGEYIELDRCAQHWSYAYKNWRAGCPDCGAWFDFIFKTEAEAIEAWNTRAGRTCHVVRKEVELPKGSDDVRKKIVYNCSECDEWLGKSANYCPNCGAKVVE